jgi:hypothetical protein
MRDSSRFAWPEGIRAAVSLTFDDGRVSQLDNCIPILDRHSVKASFYMTPSAMDDHVDQWREVLASGHEIGNHSVMHSCSGNFCWGAPNMLEDYTLEQMEAELLEAQAGLSERLGRPARTFAYPCGQSFVGRGENCRSYTPLVAKHFLAGRLFRQEAFNDPSFSDLARLCGTEGDGCDFEQLQTMLATVVEQQAWIVLAIHDVGTDQPAQVMAADTLDRLCEFCKDPANGIWIDTVEHIAEFIETNRTDG